MPQPRNLTAVLGPTNTGKTHLAVERMLASPSGMIGLPLRLLAREIYDRVRARAGDMAVALVTGEEKIIPPEPRYWVCTVEAMPSGIDVSFLAIDEVQLANDLERGHIFTDRILNRRGRDETMLLGAGTMRGIVERLLPGTNFISRPRFSRLTYAGQKKLTRLPRRTAIVAFSAETVYSLAELLRGGAAVVLGALSPRTRNAQAALYQSGDVDYLVATDAIGIGINMDVDHVAFASTRKFDGFQYRNLNAAELGQIAGRAGRHMNDGTFGVTGEAEPFEPELIGQLEDHRFEPVRILQWRNRELDYANIEALKASLYALPSAPGLTRAQAQADMLALEHGANDPEVAGLATTPEAVERLWEVCQIPDYRNISGAEHANMVGRIFRFLMGPGGRLPDDWFARQLSYCDRSDGDIDTLSSRIAHVRTWTFVANRPDWLEDPVHWQGRARDIEDRLSDALHERLTQRFIDRRTSVLMKRLRQKEDVVSAVEEDGVITVEGEPVGRIRGFQFIPETVSGDQGKMMKAASMQAVAQEIAIRAQAVAAVPDPQLSLAGDGQIMWQGAPIARLTLGPSVLKPRVTLVASDQLGGADREAVQQRLEKFLTRHIAAVLEPLVKLEEAEGLEGLTRGLAFRLVEGLGVVSREEVAEEVKGLSQDERGLLRRLGARFGAFHIFVPVLLKPQATQLRFVLWALQREKEGAVKLDALPALPSQGLTSVPFDRSTPKGFYRIAGFRLCGARAVRIDMLERLADTIRARVFWKPRFEGEPRPEGSMEGGGFVAVPDMMSLVGCSGEEFAGILRSLGFRSQKRQMKVVAKQAASDGPGTEMPAEPEAAGQAVEAVKDATAPDGGTADVEPAAEEAPAEAAVPAAPEAADEPAMPASPGDPPSVEAVAAEAPPEAGEVPSETGEPVPDADAAEASPPEGAAEMREVEVWWPKDTGPFRRTGRPEGRPGEGDRRPGRRPQRRGPRPDQAHASPAQQPAAADATAAPAPAAEEKPRRQDRPRHGGPRHEAQRQDGQSGAKPDRHEGRREGQRPASGEEQRQQRPKPQRRPEPDRSDSPFAVLGALKAELLARKKS